MQRNLGEQPRILVLGVGNVLLSDEGTGVHLINKLQQEYGFSDNVTLLDGGTLGMRLLGPISQASCLIAVDVALRGKRPGSIVRLTLNDIRTGAGVKNSMHQVSFIETLLLAEMMELLPPIVIIAIEPQDMQTMGMSLTPALAGKMDELCARVLEEIVQAGGAFYEKTGVIESASLKTNLLDCNHPAV
jgi:hydrogenase maturation protease